MFYDRVVLYIDCKQVGVKLLEPRGTVDIFGNTAIITNTDYQAVPVSLRTNYKYFDAYVNPFIGGYTMVNT